MHRAINRFSRAFAWLGGFVLSALIVLTCLSILGRSLNSVLHSDVIQSALPGLATGLLNLGIGPINGDFELVEAGMAFSIFAFLPLCQMNGAHASVDIFTNTLSPAANRLLRALIDVVFAAVIVLIAVQLFSGMSSKLSTGQTTFLLQFPTWWAYAASLTGAIAAAIVAVYLAVMRCLELTTGRTILPPDMEADH